MTLFDSLSAGQAAGGIVDAICCLFLISACLFVMLSSNNIGIFHLSEPLTHQIEPKKRYASVGRRRHTNADGNDDHHDIVRRWPWTVKFTILALVMTCFCSVFRTMRKFLFFMHIFAQNDLLCEALSKSTFVFYCLAKCFSICFLGVRAGKPFKLLHFTSRFTSKKVVIGLTIFFCLAFAVFGFLGMLVPAMISNTISHSGICRSYIADSLNFVVNIFDSFSSVLMLLNVIIPLMEMNSRENEGWNHNQVRDLIRENAIVGGSMTFISCSCFVILSLSAKYFSDADGLFSSCLLTVGLTANSSMMLYGIRKFWQMKHDWARYFGIRETFIDADSLPEREQYSYTTPKTTVFEQSRSIENDILIAAAERYSIRSAFPEAAASAEQMKDGKHFAEKD